MIDGERADGGGMTMAAPRTLADETLRSQCAALQSEMQLYELNMMELKGSSALKIQSQRTALRREESEVAELRSQLELQAMQIQVMTEELETTQRESLELISDKEHLQAELRRVRQASVEKLKAQQEQAQKKEEMLTLQLMRTAIEGKQESIHRTQAGLELKNTLDYERGQRRRLQHQVTELGTEVSCLQQELKEHREQSKKYRWTLNERKRMIEELQANVSKLTRSQETSSPVETILERMRELEKELQVSKRQIRELNIENRELLDLTGAKRCTHPQESLCQLERERLQRELVAVKRQLDCENNAERASTNAGGEIDKKTANLLTSKAAVILELSSAVCKLTKAMLNAEPHTEADLNTLFEHRLGRRTGECPLAGSDLVKQGMDTGSKLSAVSDVCHALATTQQQLEDIHAAFAAKYAERLGDNCRVQ